MRRIAIALAALLSAATPVLAAGAFVQRKIQDATGVHLTLQYDVSGTGAGPFLDVTVPSDGAGNVLNPSGGTVTDPNNASYGASTAPTGSTLAPGSGTAATPGRGIKISCPSTTSPGASAAPVAGQGYATLTLANGQTVRQPLANGGDYGIQALQVTQVGNQVTESGTLATCVFQNVN